MHKRVIKKQAWAFQDFLGLLWSSKRLNKIQAMSLGYHTSWSVFSYLHSPQVRGIQINSLFLALTDFCHSLPTPLCRPQPPGNSRNIPLEKLLKPLIVHVASWLMSICQSNKKKLCSCSTYMKYEFLMHVSESSCIFVSLSLT